MTDLLLETPHPDEQRSYAELRKEFRLTHRQSLIDQMSTHPLGWGIIGDPLRARDRYTAEEWAIELDHHLLTPVIQDFSLDRVPVEMWDRLAKLAHNSLLHESVTWDDEVEGVVDHDAPPCPPVDTLTDEQLCQYVEDSIKNPGD